MHPSCGLFSVNLLMKMPAKDSEHLNRFEKEECLYKATAFSPAVVCFHLLEKCRA